MTEGNSHSCDASEKCGVNGHSQGTWDQPASAVDDLRRLSSSLAQTLEDERRVISQGLYDRVGQMLTALRTELSCIEESRHSDDSLAQHVAEAKRLSEEAIEAVRDIALGLRPVMLDSLGLEPTLKWLAREFTRRFGVPITLQIDGNFDRVEQRYLTCMYRVVQEALSNCSLHAHASQIWVTLHEGVGATGVVVEDNGIGFDVQSGRRRGHGLLSIEEQARELGGIVNILSESRKGTLLSCTIPNSLMRRRLP